MLTSALLRKTLSGENFPKVLAVAVFLALFGLRMMIINTPGPSTPVPECEQSGSCGYIFDEAHYVPAVRKLLHGESTNHEHPPLAKLLIAASVLIFGDNPTGWRFFPSLLSSASVGLAAILSWHVTRRRDITFLATIFLASDVMFFNIGTIAILDGPALFFLVLGTLFYVREKYVAAAVFLSLAFLSKTSTLFTVAGLLIYTFIRNYARNGRLIDTVYAWSGVFEKIVIVMLIIVLGGFAAYDYYFKAFNTPFAHLDYILSYHSQLRYNCSEFELPFRCTVINQDGSRTIVDLPLSWVSPVFSFAAAPYFVTTVTAGERTWHPVAYWGIYSPLWWTTLIVAVISAYTVFKTKGKDDVMSFVFLWVLSSYGPYFIIAHILNRYVYTFYFVPTLFGLSIGLPTILSDDRFSRYVLLALSAIQVAWFFIYFPVKSETHIWILELFNLPR